MFLNDMNPQNKPILTDESLGRKKEDYDNGAILIQNLDIHSKFFRKALLNIKYDEFYFESEFVPENTLMQMFNNAILHLNEASIPLNDLELKYEDKTSNWITVIKDVLNDLEIIDEIFKNDKRFSTLLELYTEENLQSDQEKHEIDENQEFKIYQFKVSYDVDRNIFRRIKIRNDNTLEDFADKILRSFKFDDDHLYLFNMDNNYYNGKNTYKRDPFSFEKSVDIPLSKLDLKVNQNFQFWYDFGDDWFFQITLEKILDGKTFKVPMVVESNGKLYQYRTKISDSVEFKSNNKDSKGFFIDKSQTNLFDFKK